MGEYREAKVPPETIDKFVVASIARRFYLEGRSKVEIAKEFDISRFKVARLLDAAVAHHIVRIDITVPVEVDIPLSRALAERFGLRHTVVVDLSRSEGGAVAPTDAPQAGRWLSTAAAQLVSGIAEEGDVIGLDGSSSVGAFSEAVTRLPRCEVVQLTGVYGQDLANEAAAVRRTAAAGGGRGFPLYAPFILPDAPTASILRSQPAIAETLDQFGRITKAVVGIGTWGAASSAVYDVLTDRERETYTSAGACADVAGHVFDAAGQVVSAETSARMISMSVAQLRSVPELIGLSGGGARSDEALRAVLKSGMLTSVVTDATTARRLLWYDGPEEEPRTKDTYMVDTGT
ncbi:sugar-binding transcriptional regulator [Streptomyces sp. NPDC102441]|uniref:sugar-binding transcriptional regulator n=1 Tax=Streptomyces sp. NPDC102441 TaxID=3366176 RepID=UPI003827BD01